jgi:SNF2 family DNA or RNA helicase
MFHKFDTQLEQQVIGRAYRMGRELPLNVYYLLHENEIK